MSFSEAILKNKFDALEETQDSIVTTSQWVLFHYRYAQRTAEEWERYLAKAPVAKKLPLIYLANDVVQQSRAKRKTEFIDAFGTLLPNALSQAYKEVPESTKKRIAKVVNVWKERRIFPVPVELDVGSSNGSSSSHEESNVSFDDKLKSLGSSSQKFQRIYHELLLASNGNFKNTDIKPLNSLKKVINDNIIQLQDLTETIEDEIGHIHEREKHTEEKRLELENKQKELEEQRQKEEQERLEAERKREEEESMMPTYEDSGSDSDNESNSDAESDAVSETKEEIKEEPKVEEKQESAKPEDGQPPVKKLRFAD